VTHVIDAQARVLSHLVAASGVGASVRRPLLPFRARRRSGAPVGD
jgi:hypothetical protein